MTQAIEFKQSNTHVAILGGEQIACNEETLHDVCAQLIERHGDGAKLRVVPIENTTRVEELTSTQRAVRDEAVALENGFNPEPPLFTIGTKVNQLGVKNARASQEEHNAKPWARDVCTGLIDQVFAEQRQDLPKVRLSDLRMNDQGLLVLNQRSLGNVRSPLDDRAFKQLFGKFPCASGGAYLADCPTKLRSINFNHWARELDELESAPNATRTDVVLRTRKLGNNRGVFAAVSPKYTPFDVDKVAQALRIAFPDDAKGSADYNGRRVRIEGLWHSDVAPEEFVAGEIFKAGVVVRTDDTGGGSLRVQSVIWRNLCLNLIILDKAVGVDVRIRHMGSVTQLAAKLRQAFSKALQSVNAFRVAWNSAMQEEGRKLVEAVQGTTRDDLGPLPVEQVLPGIFNGILERDLVPVRGRKADVVPKLLEMHTQDEAADKYGVSRASVVNAFTRYAHQVETNPFRADDIREGAGALLSGSRGRQPAPLPYVAFNG